MPTRCRPAPKPKGMNKLEYAYSVQLELLRKAGEVDDYGFEKLRLRIGPGAWYTPDFMVITSAGQVECHECKGFMREAARVRLHVAAGLFPHFIFRLVTRPKDDVGFTVREVDCG